MRTKRALTVPENMTTVPRVIGPKRMPAPLIPYWAQTPLAAIAQAEAAGIK
jgi:hypothetical protein